MGEDDFWTELDEFSSSLFQDESYEGSQSSPTSLVAGTSEFLPLYDQDDVFSPLSSSAGSSSFPMPSATATQSQQEIPVPPDISPLLHGSRLSSSEQTVSRVPTPPDIMPLLKGALSSANIQLPLASVQSSAVSNFLIARTAATFSVLIKMIYLLNLWKPYPVLKCTEMCAAIGVISEFA